MRMALLTNNNYRFIILHQPSLVYTGFRNWEGICRACSFSAQAIKIREGHCRYLGTRYRRHLIVVSIGGNFLMLEMNAVFCTLLKEYKPIACLNFFVCSLCPVDEHYKVFKYSDFSSKL